jgi:D-alanine-D-alanine ligase
MARLSVAVIQGGPSSEAEVSRASAKGVAQALGEAGHQVVRFELDAYLAESIRQGGFDVVFPVVHGAVGEDGSLQGLLEVLEVPYVGSGVLASALAMEKRQARVAFAAAGLPVARGLSAVRGEESAIDAARRARRDVGARVVVKPAAGGSGLGVARFEEAADDEAVAKAIEAAWELSDAALLEHFARGREVTCGILDAGELVAFPPTEIASPRDAFYTYEARYAPGRSVHACPAPLGDALTGRVQRVAREAHRALGCRDLSRVDFVVGDDGAPDAVTLLEVNTLPGFTATSLYPEAAAVAGIPMRDLVDRLARHAKSRGSTRRSAPRPLPR